jgi:hypothetical protein
MQRRSNATGLRFHSTGIPPQSAAMTILTFRELTPAVPGSGSSVQNRQVVQARSKSDMPGQEKWRCDACPGKTKG